MVATDGDSARGEKERVPRSPASQKTLMSQGAKTSPKLDTTVGRCRQGIRME